MYEPYWAMGREECSKQEITDGQTNRWKERQADGRADVCTNKLITVEWGPNYYAQNYLLAHLPIMKQFKMSM